MREKIAITLDNRDIALNLDETQARRVITYCESMNRAANDLCELMQELTSDLEAMALRRFFGNLMGTIISEIIIPIEHVIRDSEGTAPD